MSYKYQKGSTPDFMSGGVESTSTAKDDHGLTGSSDSDPKKPGKYSPADSVEKYDSQATSAARQGDPKAAAEAMGKYNKYNADNIRNHLQSDADRVKANSDSANKYGPVQAALKGKLSVGGDYFYGAEDLDSAKVVNAAKTIAARDSKNRKNP